MRWFGFEFGFIVIVEFLGFDVDICRLFAILIWWFVCFGACVYMCVLPAQFRFRFISVALLVVFVFACLRLAVLYYTAVWVAFWD